MSTAELSDHRLKPIKNQSSVYDVNGPPPHLSFIQYTASLEVGYIQPTATFGFTPFTPYTVPVLGRLSVVNLPL
jgi:hypothetical protein